MSNITSCKLLNYAQVNNGNLQLFTELNHTFNIGDNVYIIGGYYDNTDINESNVFQTTSYKIIALDYSNNSITINYHITPLDLVFPYGNSDNKFGNPQDVDNLAYNNYLNDDLYKYVYISTCIFNGNRFKSGIINNGIFGNDNKQINISYNDNNLINENNVNINYIVSKNIQIGKATINSKELNQLTRKFRVVEDISNFNIEQISIQTNNNSYGYSYYERFKNIDNCIINNGEFINPGHGFIELNNLIINKGKIGGTIIYNDSIQCNDVIINSGELLNINTNNTLFTGNNIKINNGYKLNVSNIEINPTLPRMVLTVEYSDITNLLYLVGKQFILHGLFKETMFSYIIIDQLNNIEILSVDYTWGNINSIDIEIEFIDFVSNWNTLYTFYSNINFYNLDQVYISDLQIDNKYLLNNITGDIIINSDNCLINNSTISGYFKNISFENCNFILGNTNNILFNCTQLYTNTQFNGNILTNNNLENALVTHDTNNNLVNYNINNCYIMNPLLNNCIIDNSYLLTQFGSSYLYRCSLNKVYMNNNISWQRCKFYNNVMYVINNTEIVQTGQYGERSTPWITNINATSQVLPGEEIFNFDNIEIFTNPLPNLPDPMQYYGGQYIQENDSNELHIPKNTMYWQIPNIENITTLESGDKYNINYINLQNQTNILFKSILTDTDSQFDSALISRASNDQFFEHPLFPDTIELIGVDNTNINEIYKFNLKNYNRTGNIMNALIKKNNPITPPTFPHYENNIDFINLNILDVNFNETYTTTNGGIVDINLAHNMSGAFEFEFEFNTTLLDINNNVATQVPACFIEIERTIMNYYNIFTNSLVDIKIYNNNFIPDNLFNENKFAYNNIIELSQFPNQFKINNPLKYDKTSNSYINVYIEYWITWYYNQEFNITHTESPNLKTIKREMHRTKHIFSTNIYVY